MSTEPRWTLADGTEVGIGDTVWQVGKCLSRRVTGRARFHNGLNHVAVDGNRQKFLAMTYLTHQALTDGGPG